MKALEIQKPFEQTVTILTFAGYCTRLARKLNGR